MLTKSCSFLIKPTIAQQADLIRSIAEHYLYSHSPDEKVSKADKAKFSFVHREYTKLKRLNIQEMQVSGQPYRDANFHHHICDRTHHRPNPQLKTDTNQKPP